MSFNHMSDEYWAEKLRRENCDQFNTLVRMHLSFVLDLNTDENDYATEKSKLKKWSFVPFVKKSKIVNRGVMEGAPLTQEGICQVYQLIEYLSKKPNICSEGIFRRTGSLTRQQELRSLLNQGQSLNLDDGRYSVHDCASVLKGFLAELPEPLLTEAHYPAHCQIAELCSVQSQSTEKRLLQALQLLLLLLPTENRVLLRDVLQLLHETMNLESSNKMTADSLATLFTPHLLCPRRLSPEALHTDSQKLSRIIAFMIRRGCNLFEIPSKLALDIRSYFTTVANNSDRSPGSVVNTVYSFIDHERTARAHGTNPTETALAQLYDHIKDLPESAIKRKYVKQLSRQNGNGTPVLQSALRSKSFGDSIKRHIFFNKTIKKNNDQLNRLRSSSEEMLNSPNCVPLASRTRLFCVDCPSSDSEVDSHPDTSHQSKSSKLIDKSTKSLDDSDWYHRPHRRTTRCYSESDLSSDGGTSWRNCLTSTPAVIATLGRQLLTPSVCSFDGRKSMSPITRSTQKMSRAMQETMMTPRSRKPVLLMSAVNACSIPKLELATSNNNCSSSLPETEDEEQHHHEENGNETSLLLTESPIDSPVDASFSSRTDDYYSLQSDDDDEEEENIDDLTGEHIRNSSFRKRSAVTPDSYGESKKPNRFRIEIEKKPILRPKQFNSNGEPIVFETSF